MAQETETRTSLPDAVKIILETIQKSKGPLTVNDIVRETHLNPRTVRKSISVLEQVHDVFSKENMVVSRTSAGIFLTMEPRQIGLLSLPEDVQKMLIRTKYFPQPSREQEILLFLYMKQAFDPESATFLDGTQQIVKDLLESENIATADSSKMYLTEIGKTVAEGTLEIYPEIKTV